MTVDVFSCSSWFVLITGGQYVCVCAVARWLCGTLHLALVTVVFHRDANHQACTGGMIKCHTAPLASAITVNKSSSPTGCEGVESAAPACAAWSVQSHSATHRSHFKRQQYAYIMEPVMFQSSSMSFYTNKKSNCIFILIIYDSNLRKCTFSILFACII